MAMECVNLKQQFGDRYKVEFEQSYRDERPEFRAQEASWLMVIPCQHGEICPWGDDTLAVCSKTAGSVAKRLKALPFVTVAQDGADGVNVVFSLEHFEEVAAIMKPRRRRQVSEAERQRLAEMSARYSPFRRKEPPVPFPESPNSAQISTIAVRGD